MKYTLAQCPNPECAWQDIRFPLHGVTEKAPLVCGMCQHYMRLDTGEPHPIAYIQAFMIDAQIKMEKERVNGS